MLKLRDVAQSTCHRYAHSDLWPPRTQPPPTRDVLGSVVSPRAGGGSRLENVEPRASSEALAPGLHHDDRHHCCCSYRHPVATMVTDHKQRCRVHRAAHVDGGQS